jgi:hypothetical protein
MDYEWSTTVPTISPHWKKDVTQQHPPSEKGIATLHLPLHRLGQASCHLAASRCPPGAEMISVPVCIVHANSYPPSSMDGCLLTNVWTFCQVQSFS